MKNICFYVLCCVVLFACSDLRGSIGGKGIFTLSLFELLAYVLLVGMYMCVLPIVRDREFKKQHELVFASPTKWLALYLLWGLFAAVVFLEDPQYTIQVDYKKLLSSAIAYMGILLFASDTRRKLHMIQIVWLSAGLINVTVALSQYIFSVPDFGRSSGAVQGKLDLTGEVVKNVVTGFVGSQNEFAQIIMPWFIVAAVVLLTKKRVLEISSLVWLVLSILFGFVLFATFSKGALLWSIAGIVLGVAMTKWRTMRSFLWFLLPAFTIVAGINTLALYQFRTSTQDIFGTIPDRINLAIACWHLLINHPINAIMGGGLRYWDQYVYEWGTWSFYDAHNVYLNQILMYGTVGMLLLSAFVVSCIRRGVHKLTNVQCGLLSPFPYVGAVFAMIGGYWFEPSFKDAIQKYQLFFALAMLMVLRKLSDLKADGNSQRRVE